MQVLSLLYIPRLRSHHVVCTLVGGRKLFTAMEWHEFSNVFTLCPYLTDEKLFCCYLVSSSLRTQWMVVNTQKTKTWLQEARGGVFLLSLSIGSHERRHWRTSPIFPSWLVFLWTPHQVGPWLQLSGFKRLNVWDTNRFQRWLWLSQFLPT